MIKNKSKLIWSKIKNCSRKKTRLVKVRQFTKGLVIGLGVSGFIFVILPCAVAYAKDNLDLPSANFNDVKKIKVILKDPDLKPYLSLPENQEQFLSNDFIGPNIPVPTNRLWFVLGGIVGMGLTIFVFQNRTSGDTGGNPPPIPTRRGIVKFFTYQQQKKNFLDYHYINGSKNL